VHQVSSHYKGTYWQRQRLALDQRTTFSPCRFSGRLTLDAPEVLIQHLRHHTLDFLGRLSTTGTLHYDPLDPVLVHTTQSLQGPSRGLAAVVSVVALVATQGLGAALASTLGFAEAGLEATLVTAAVSSSSSRLAVGVLEKGGDVGAALKTLTSPQALKALALDLGTAGLTHGVGHKIGVVKPTSQRLGKLDTLGKLQAHFHFNALKATIGTTLNITIGGTLFNRALAQGGTALAVHSLGDFLAGELGQAYSLGKGELGYLPHKLLHGILGASVGAGMHKALGTDRGGNLGESALGGALGALMAEVVAEATLGEDLGLRVVETARLRGEKLTQDTYAQALEAAVHRSQLWGQLAGGITALVAGQDVEAAVLSATHATENNFAFTALPYLMGAGYGIWTAVTIYDAYCQGGPEAALS
jgi:hypothetical protein